MKIVQQVRKISHRYVRKGGKNNRRQQRNTMIVFAEFAAAKLGAQDIGQIGKRHVVEYWKHHRELQPRTSYNHWLALCELWRLMGKPSKPPKPRCDLKKTISNKGENHQNRIS